MIMILTMLIVMLKVMNSNCFKFWKEYGLFFCEYHFKKNMGEWDRDCFCKQDNQNKIRVFIFTFQSERFVLCAKVCPTAFFGYKPPPDGYMFVIGVIETLSSILLMLPLTNLHTRIYLVFCVLMALAIYTHGILAQYGKLVVPICLFLACLVLYKTGTLSLSKIE